MQTRAAMRSKLRPNGSSSQNPLVWDNQSNPLRQSLPVGGDPLPEQPVSDAEERNCYHNFNRKWVARSDAVQAIKLPCNSFFKILPIHPIFLMLESQFLVCR